MKRVMNMSLLVRRSDMSIKRQQMRIMHEKFSERIRKVGITDEEINELAMKMQKDVRKANRTNSN